MQQGDHQPMDVEHSRGAPNGNGNEENLSSLEELEQEPGRYVKAVEGENYFSAISRFQTVFKKIFTGDGPRGSTQTEWQLFKGLFLKNAVQLNIPEHFWGDIAFSFLDGSALKSVLADTAKLSHWEALDTFFSAGPFQQPDTDYSVRTAFYEGNKWRVEQPHAVHGLVRRCEAAFAKAPNGLSDIEKIIAVQYNLPVEVRQQVMVNQQNTSFTQYEEFRVVLLTKVNAMPSSSGSVGGSRRWDNHPNGKRSRSSSSNPRRSSMDRGRRSSQEQQRPNGHGNNGDRNGGEHRPCTGCGSTTHQVTWMDKNGNPVCPRYDPSKAPHHKKKTVSFQKRS